MNSIINIKIGKIFGLIKCFPVSNHRRYIVFKICILFDTLMIYIYPVYQKYLCFYQYFKSGAPKGSMAQVTPSKFLKGAN